MHWKDLRAAGESEQRLYSLDAWRECPVLQRTRARRARVDRGGDAGQPTATCRTRSTTRSGRTSPRRSWPTSRWRWPTINAWNRLSIAARIRARDAINPQARAERQNATRDAAVEHPAVERRPGVDGPAAVGARRRSEQRIPPRLAHVRSGSRALTKRRNRPNRRSASRPTMTYGRDSVAVRIHLEPLHARCSRPRARHDRRPPPPTCRPARRCGAA